MTPEALLSPQERERIYHMRENGTYISVHQGSDEGTVIVYGSSDYEDPFAKPVKQDDSWA